MLAQPDALEPRIGFEDQDRHLGNARGDDAIRVADRASPIMRGDQAAIAGDFHSCPFVAIASSCDAEYVLCIIFPVGKALTKPSPSAQRAESTALMNETHLQ